MCPIQSIFFNPLLITLQKRITGDGVLVSQTTWTNFAGKLVIANFVARHLRRATPSPGAGQSSTCRVPCRIGGAAQWMFEENHVESHPIMRPVQERI